eukprot:scaffold78421_cov63-Phaeocystis_antarctica.AAC.1
MRPPSPSRRELSPTEGDAHAAAGWGQVRVVDGMSPVEAHVARLDLQRAARQQHAHRRPRAVAVVVPRRSAADRHSAGRCGAPPPACSSARWPRWPPIWRGARRAARASSRTARAARRVMAPRAAPSVAAGRSSRPTSGRARGR